MIFRRSFHEKALSTKMRSQKTLSGSLLLQSFLLAASSNFTNRSFYSNRRFRAPGRPDQPQKQLKNTFQSNE